MRALVAMSGGVDSSVAAGLMAEAGHDVVGVTLKQWEGPDGRLPSTGCCTLADAEDARRVAAVLGVPYYVLDYRDEFRQAVVDRFGDEYAAGRTPNPCIECNRRVRFRALLDRVEELGCDVLVTGHHARIRRDAAGHHLLRAVDPAKDQSYVLHMLGQEELERIRLPVGEMTKDEVRERARAMGMRVATKPDSQDLCFVGHGDYRDVVRRLVPGAARPGQIVDMDGSVLGSHDGTVDYTIGQRRGLGIAVGDPRYVVEIRPGSATVVVGRKEDLMVDGCDVGEVSWVGTGPPPPDEAVGVAVRYRGRPIPATVESLGGVDRVRIRFTRPAGGVAPGQSAVVYRGDEVLGGGVIERPVRAGATARVGLPAGATSRSRA